MEQETRVVQTSEQIAGEIVDSWGSVEKPQARPLMLFLAGFQGFGKTTLLHNIKDEFGLTIISLDQVREMLFAREFALSQEFVDVVDKTRDLLVLEACRRGLSFAVDTIMTPKRIKHLKSLIPATQFTNYRVVTVFLEAPVAELEQRVEKRPKIPGLYRGNVDELYGSIKKHGPIDMAEYELIIDTKSLSPDETAQVVRDYLNS